MSRLLKLFELTNFNIYQDSDPVTKFTDRLIQVSIEIDVEMNEEYTQMYGTNIYTYDNVYPLSIPEGYKFCKTVKDLPPSARDDLNTTIKTLINGLINHYKAIKINDVRITLMDSNCDLTIGPAKYLGS